VLITGESARQRSDRPRHSSRQPRATRPLSHYCAAIPSRYSVGAVRSRPRRIYGSDGRQAGLFEQASGAPCCSTRSASCPSDCRPSCCASFRRARSAASATRRPVVWMRACSRRRRAISRRRPRLDGSRGPLLSDQRRGDRAAAAAGARGGHRALARHFAARLAQRFGRPLSLSDEAVAWLEQRRGRATCGSSRM